MEMTSRIEETAQAFEERLRPQIEEAKRRVSDIGRETRTFIKEHPGACLVGAVALGYLIARIARR